MPTLVNQLTAGGQYPHEDCGEACTVSILCDAGKSDTVLGVERFDAAHGDSPADGTGGAVHVARLAAAGISAHVAATDPIAEIEAAVASGVRNRIMVAIFSDHAGNPATPASGIGHWLLWCGVDEAGDVWMQPVGGYIARYTHDQIRAAAQSYNVVIDARVGDAVTVVPALYHGSDPTNTDGTTMDVQEVAATVKLAYEVAALRRAIEATHGPLNEDAFRQDSVDVQGFDNQVSAVMTKSADLHTVVNNIVG